METLYPTPFKDLEIVRNNYRLKRTFSAAIAVRNAHQTAELQHFFHGKKTGGRVGRWLLKKISLMFTSIIHS
jgi:hypothetical protein